MADSLKILDISKYQPNVDYAKTAKDVDGVILRIGITYWGKQDMGKDPYFEKHYAGFKAQKVPVGVYYYSAADSVAVAKKEAEYCLSLLKGKQFELPIYYDVENNERQGKLSKAVLSQIVDVFCDTVQSAGYFVGYYSYTSWLLSKFDTATLSKKYTLWKADYRVHPNTSIPCDMHQYTSSGVVSGISGRVDLNHCYRNFTAEIKKAGLNGFTKSTTPTTKPALKSVKEIAKEVLEGKWGNGDERRSKLAKAGYNYSEVQKAVNELLKEQQIEKVAKEVLAGKWGNGVIRRARLIAAGYNYSEVQKAVNKLL